jgi:hypothetical protein
MESSKKIEYIYDASGTKFQTKYTESAGVFTRDYASNRIYDNNVLTIRIRD